MVKSSSLKICQRVQSVATKSKNLNTETEMVGSFYRIMPKTHKTQISSGVTFSPNLMQMIKCIAQNPLIKNFFPVFTGFGPNPNQLYTSFRCTFPPNFVNICQGFGSYGQNS